MGGAKAYVAAPPGPFSIVAVLAVAGTDPEEEECAAKAVGGGEAVVVA